MAKRSNEQQPAVRKSFLVWGGIVVAIAGLAFVLMTFLGGGGGSGEASNAPSSPAPATQADGSDAKVQPAAPGEGLRAGGRNPFVRG